MEQMILFCISTMFIPGILGLCGVFMTVFTPKSINSWVGYRTSRSMENEHTWKYANQLCGKIWIGLSLALWVVSIVFVVLLKDSGKQIQGLAGIGFVTVQMGLLLLSLIPVELALKKKYKKEKR